MNKTITTLTLALTALALSMGAANALSIKLPPPSKKPVPMAQNNDCADEVGYLRPIRANQVAEMGEYGLVYLVETCAGQPEKFSDLFSRGNASGLRTAIAQNDVLASALYEKDFEPRDVFGIARGANQSVYLYVHKAGR